MRTQKHPLLWDWGRRKGRPWSSDDVICARFLRHCGMSDEDIGEVLHRSAGSVQGKIGYPRKRKYIVTQELRA